MKVSREHTINELKILRRLVELLALAGEVSAFDRHHIAEFLDGDGSGMEYDAEVPFNLAFVMATINLCYEDPSDHCEDQQEAFYMLADACSFVAPKEKEEFNRLSYDFQVGELFPEKGADRYKRLTLPILLKIIDLALKESKPLD